MASVEKNERGEWRVRWREGGRNRAKLIGPRKADAITFKGEIERAQRLGTVAHLEMGKLTLREFTEQQYWPSHAAKTSRKTQVLYAYLLDKHIIPHLGSLPLAQITPGATEAWLASLERDGTGRVAQQRALALLIGVLNRAVKWGELHNNAAALADKPKHRPEPIEPPTPAEVETIRARLKHGDATLTSVLAYAGLRPQEALALRWTDIGDRVIRIGAEHKTGHRSVGLLAPLAADLKEWKLACGGRWELVFPNTRGERWSESGWGNWRRRTWYGTEDNPGAAYGMGIHPYALRHTYVSLLIRDGRNVIEVAKQAGHSPEVCLRTYAHAWAELAGIGSAEDAIREARVQQAESQAG